MDTKLKKIRDILEIKNLQTSDTSLFIYKTIELSFRAIRAIRAIQKLEFKNLDKTQAN